MADIDAIFGTVLEVGIKGDTEMTTDTLNFPVWQTDKAAIGEIAKPMSYASAKDFDLTQLASKGDMTAFEEIYQRHHRRIYSICLRMLQNAHEAEDLTQDVFIQLYRKIGSFRGDSAFTTWLHRMTVNQVLMHFRKRNVKFEKVTEEGETPDQIVAGTSNPNKMPIVDKIALQNAIEQLPAGYKNVFVLHDVEGFEHEEVAKILGCSVGTSKSQLHKARLKLRKLLKKKANPRLVGVGY
ncbi:MAG TPA: RNA polymerase sigma factor [Pyrinomonadaceae bacterium]|nr:RNA polymerase sigma factor [Pyrinomonadaceae bacterium]